MFTMLPIIKGRYMIDRLCGYAVFNETFQLSSQRITILLMTAGYFQCLDAQ